MAFKFVDPLHDAMPGRHLPIDPRIRADLRVGRPVRVMKGQEVPPAGPMASLANSLAGPQRTSAKTSQYEISSDSQFYSYAKQQTSSAPYGVAAG
jgi:hypothetical protein